MDWFSLWLEFILKPFNHSRNVYFPTRLWERREAETAFSVQPIAQKHTVGGGLFFPFSPAFSNSCLFVSKQDRDSITGMAFVLYTQLEIGCLQPRWRFSLSLLKWIPCTPTCTIDACVRLWWDVLPRALFPPVAASRFFFLPLRFPFQLSVKRHWSAHWPPGLNGRRYSGCRQNCSASRPLKTVRRTNTGKRCWLPRSDRLERGGGRVVRKGLE